MKKVIKIFSIIIIIVLACIGISLLMSQDKRELAKHIDSNLKCALCGSDMRINGRYGIINPEIVYSCTNCSNTFHYNKLLNIENIITNDLNKLNKIRVSNGLPPMKELPKEEIEILINNLSGFGSGECN